MYNYSKTDRSWANSGRCLEAKIEVLKNMRKRYGGNWCNKYCNLLEDDLNENSWYCSECHLEFKSSEIFPRKCIELGKRANMNKLRCSDQKKITYCNVIENEETSWCDKCGLEYDPYEPLPRECVKNITIQEKEKDMNDIEELTRLVDKAIHNSVGEVVKMLKEEKTLEEEYKFRIKEKRLAMGKIVRELKAFDSRVTELYPELRNTFWDLNREYDTGTDAK
jgi:hypothetical protein